MGLDLMKGSALDKDSAQLWILLGKDSTSCGVKRRDVRVADLRRIRGAKVVGRHDTTKPKMDIEVWPVSCHSGSYTKAEKDKCGSFVCDQVQKGSSLGDSFIIQYQGFCALALCACFSGFCYHSPHPMGNGCKGKKLPFWMEAHQVCLMRSRA
jgi:hypothetical protein